jgi:hypothetical protein
MDVFALRDRVIEEYASYVKSFIRIKDPSLSHYVEEQLRKGRLWPDPLVQLNPSFEPGETVEELVTRGVLAEECRRIFRRDKDDLGFGPSLRLHRHQQEAVEIAATGQSYVLTTGTGSGKSLAYFIPIVDYLLRQRSGLTEEETAYVLDPRAVYGDDFPGETFRVLKENETKKFGEYRTQRLVQSYYRARRDGERAAFDRWLSPRVERGDTDSGGHLACNEGVTKRLQARPIGGGISNREDQAAT